jgi:uncharacterized protein YecE (DUF72 family)
VRSLFDDTPRFDRDGLASRVGALVSRGALIGTSSWKYPGWLEQVYSPERYLSRGKFSKQRFEAECIAEYAETFPTVCGDFAFYQFPTLEFWSNLFRQVPASFQFSFKVPEQITRMEFPRIARYGPQAGRANEQFLNAEMLKSNFLQPLEAFQANVGVLILEFGALLPRQLDEPELFLERLDGFLGALPTGFRFAIEVRNPELLIPAYFECLREHGVAHVYNAWTRMPDLPDQIAIPNSRTADFIVCRALLRRGRNYEEAVQKFSPYLELREPYPPAREGIKQLIQLPYSERTEKFVYLNNRLEGNAPSTIAALVADW